jgi:hypothetical protein
MVNKFGCSYAASAFVCKCYLINMNIVLNSGIYKPTLYTDCTTALFNILDPTCFGSSLPSSGSFVDPSELLEIQIEWVVYCTMHGYVACVPQAHRPHNHTLYDIPPIQSVFRVT